MGLFGSSGSSRFIAPVGDFSRLNRSAPLASCVAGQEGDTIGALTYGADAKRKIENYTPPEPIRSMFEQAFKNIDDVLRKEAGCTTELDYTEQTSWLLFLKYLDGLEQDKAMEVALEGKKYTFILDTPYRWESWAAPKGKDGKLDHNTAMVGDDTVHDDLLSRHLASRQSADPAARCRRLLGTLVGDLADDDLAVERERLKDQIEPAPVPFRDAATSPSCLAGNSPRRSCEAPPRPGRRYI